MKQTKKKQTDEPLPDVLDAVAGLLEFAGAVGRVGRITSRPVVAEDARRRAEKLRQLASDMRAGRVTITQES